MRTTMDLPDELLETAQRLSHTRTKREAVIAGLEELIRRARVDELRKMAGGVELDLDLRKSRGKRTP